MIGRRAFLSGGLAVGLSLTVIGCGKVDALVAKVSGASTPATATATVVPPTPFPTFTIPTPAASPTPFPLPTPVPPPTATPTPSIGTVGQTVTAAGIALTINSVKRVAAIGDVQKARAGNTFVLADVTIQNSGSAALPYNPLYFKVMDGDGYEYDETLNPQTNSLKDGSLAPGRKVRGTVAFEVPKDAKGLVVEYKPLGLLSTGQTIRITLP